MSDDETAEKGLLGALTAAETGRDEASPGAGGALAELDQDEAGDDEDLLTGSPDLGATDLLSMAADTVAGPRRARGRPKGSANKRNMDMVAYLAALGHRDPMVTLSLIQTADPVELAKKLGTPVFRDGKPVRDVDGSVVYDTPDPMAILQMQRQAASDMLPYFYAKKPQQLELPDGGQVQHFISIGEATFNVGRRDSGVVDLGALQAVRVEKPNEINGDAVRDQDADVREAEKLSNNNDMDTPNS